MDTLKQLLIQPQSVKKVHIIGAAIMATASCVLTRLLRRRPARFSEVPGFFLIGVASQVGPGITHWAKKIDEWAKTFGHEGAFEFNLLGERYVVPCDWEDAKKVLLSRPVKVTKPKVYGSIGWIAHGGVFFSEGESWKRERRLVSPAFNAKNIDSYTPAIQETVDALLNKLEEDRSRNQLTNFSDLFTLFASDVIVKVSTGLDLGILKDGKSEIYKNVDRLFAALAFRMSMPLPYWKAPWLGNLIDGGDGAKRRIIQTMTGAMEKMAGSGVSTIVEKLREAQGDKLTKEEVADILVALLAAGTDTTSKALSWAFYFLSLNPDLQDKVAAEARGLNGIVSPEQLKALTLANAVWLETLRVKGPVPFDIFTNDETLIIAGREVLPGTSILVPYRYLLHSAAEVNDALGADLDKFRPERWIGADGNIIKVPTFGTMFFGHGARICLGMKLADYEGPLVIAKVLQRFQLKRWQGPELTEKCGFVLEPATEVRIAMQARS